MLHHRGSGWKSDIIVMIAKRTPLVNKSKLIRRPIKARETRWAGLVTVWLARAGIRPNQISLLSVVFAGVSGASLIAGATGGVVWHAILFITAALFIQ